jgi:hypothetical protein
MDVTTIKSLTGSLIDIPLLFKQVKFTNKDIYMYYTVSDNESGRMDLIAHKIYGNSKLWWAIAIANQIEDSLVEPTSGRTLKIPSVTAVQRWL